MATSSAGNGHTPPCSVSSYSEVNFLLVPTAVNDCSLFWILSHFFEMSNLSPIYLISL